VVVGVEHPGERAEAGDQRLGSGLGIAARAGSEQQVLQHFVVGERLGPAFEQPLTQPCAVACGIGGFALRLISRHNPPSSSECSHCL
jgi:hypothetical protein